eukprot:768672-Hanusia_phi.AAC.17
MMFSAITEMKSSELQIACNKAMKSRLWLKVLTKYIILYELVFYQDNTACVNQIHSVFYIGLQICPCYPSTNGSIPTKLRTNLSLSSSARMA